MIQNETLRIDPELKENHPARYRRSDSQLLGIVSILLYSLSIGPMYGYVQVLRLPLYVCAYVTVLGIRDHFVGLANFALFA